jgi:DNA-binding response OmpR family regulator
MRSQRTQRREIREQLEGAEPRKRLVAWRPRRSVLLIEDDADMRRLLALALRRDGYRVFEASNGDDALDWLGPGVLEGEVERIPDVIVSDVRLPYFSGFEILECLKVAAPRIPVILITGFPDESTHRLAAQLHAECVIEKPFELDELRAAVRRTLAQQLAGTAPRLGHD